MVKLELDPRAKKVAIGVLVVAMGALGVAGGNRTIGLLKAWFNSLLHRS